MLSFFLQSSLHSNSVNHDAWCSTVGGAQYRGGVQYRGGYHEYHGGYHEYRGGYLEYRGVCSVPWGISL